MAVRVNAGDDVKRRDHLQVDPTKVEMREGSRGRTRPPSDERIIAMAESMLTEGQLSPVECRLAADRTLVLTFGFTRTAAARLIRTGFTDGAGAFHQDPAFMLKVIVVERSEADAFRRNVVENAHRNETSPIDDAWNQEKLRDQHGMSDADIARLYRCDPSSVHRLKQLLKLPPKEQGLVHENKLSVEGALALLDLPEEQRPAVIEAASTDEGCVSGSEVKRQVRDHHLRDQPKASAAEGEPPTASAPSSNGHSPPKPPRKRPLTVKEIREFFERISESNPGKLHAYASTVVLWLNGQKRDADHEEALAALAGKKAKVAVKGK